MGYFYDWVEEKWKPKRDETLSLSERRQVNRRSTLLRELIAEIEQGGDGISRLYAGLLARALLATDEELMRDHGERIVKLTSPCENTASSERVQK